jgi:hypothetical protein
MIFGLSGFLTQDPQRKSGYTRVHDFISPWL